MEMSDSRISCMEWSEEKFLRGIVGYKRRLRFWNKPQKIEPWLLFTQLVRYNRMNKRVTKYQNTVLEILANKSNLSRHKGDIWFVLLAHICSWPAAWAKDLSSDAFFRSIPSFGDPHYLSRTFPDSIQSAWNSRIWNFEWERKTLLPLRNLWNFVSCKRFRPVRILWVQTMRHIKMQSFWAIKKCPILLSKIKNNLKRQSPLWIWSTEILFQIFQIFHNILLNLANFGGRPMTKSMQIPEKRIHSVGNHVKTVGTC